MLVGAVQQLLNSFENLIDGDGRPPVFILHGTQDVWRAAFAGVAAAVEKLTDAHKPQDGKIIDCIRSSYR